MTDVFEELKELDKILKIEETKLATLEGTKNAKLDELKRNGFDSEEDAKKWFEEAEKILINKKEARDKKFIALKEVIEW